VTRQRRIPSTEIEQNKGDNFGEGEVEVETEEELAIKCLRIYSHDLDF
jgi:hypothetical protein